MPAALQELSPSERIARSLIDDTTALVSPPDVCLKINELVADERTSLEDIAAVVIRDPSLTAKVLKLANSPYYGLATKVDTVSRAVMLLGMRELQKLVCALCAVQSFSKLSSAVTNMNSFWRHAVYTGLAAQALARHANVLHPERLFVAGVMHDIGTLLINQRFPELAEVAIREAAGSEDELYRIEHARLGFDHAHLAGLMLHHWRLPAALVDAVTMHHAPHQARLAPVDAAILKVADGLANFSGTGSYSETVAAADADDSLLQRYGISLNCSNDELMDEVDRQFVDT
ncbi:MAG: HDOD domain-containing protein, partial [Gammaproteobacteria bacterium]